MERVLQSVILLINVGLVQLSDCCYEYNYINCNYCSGYCSGYIGNQECILTHISVGRIIGAVIGSLIGLAILIAIIVVVCASCNKSAGQRGRIVHPSTQGIAVVQSQGTSSYYNGGHTPVVHNTMSYSTYSHPADAAYPPQGMPQPAACVPQPPTYPGVSQDPPPYKI